jgi:vancomycin resistance protein YoaR
VSEQAPTPRTSRRTPILIVAGIAAVIAVSLGIFVATNGTVRPGTTVSGVDIGGMSPDEAIGVLEDSVSTKVNRKLEISAGDQVFELRPRAAGITLDAQATVDQATSTGFNPFQMIVDLFGSREIEPVIAVDQDALEDSVASIADVVNLNPVEPQLAVSNSGVTLTQGRDGLEVDREALKNQIVSMATQTRSTIEAPLEVTPQLACRVG